MSTRLPSRRFREAQWLVVATLVLLVAMVVVELQGMVTLARAAEEEARRGAEAAAVLVGADLSQQRGLSFRAGPREGLGIALLVGDRVVERAGLAGPETPAWWPWPSRGEWEREGRPVAGPISLPGGPVMVAYQPVDDQRMARVVLRVASASLLGRWRWVGAGLALLVAGAGGVLAIALVGRLVAPYRDLLEEASRVGGPPRGEAEDRFLVTTFRETVRRLEASETALRERADELAVLADVLTRESGSGVVIVDSGGAVRAGNATAGELLGRDLPTGSLLPDEIRAVSGRVRLGDRVVGVRRFPLLNKEGETQGGVLFLADTTRLDALERALAEREQMALIGELSAGMAHELRNALATITGYLRLVGDATASDRDRYLAAIGEEARSLGELLERFMRFAQPQQLRREPISLRRLAEEVAQRVRGAFPTVAVAVEGDDVTVEGDPLGLAVVFENLVRNGAEAVRARPGAVTVTVAARPDGARVTVADDGPGVASEIAGSLFTPFVSTKPSGGLGLAMARRFARLHGGEVSYEPGRSGGAVFIVELPAGGVA